MFELIVALVVVIAGVAGHKLGWYTIPLLNYVPGMSNSPKDGE